MRDATAHASWTNNGELQLPGKRMISLSAVLDSAQVSRALGDLQVAVCVECETTIETRRRRVVALTKRLVTLTRTAIYDTRASES
jgi:hypothetical protein